MHEKLPDSKTWAGILRVGEAVGVTGEPYG